MTKLNRFHFWLGITGTLLFILTGQYMDKVHNHLQKMADGPRMLYRSAHIYLLLAAVVNLALCWMSQRAPWMRWQNMRFSRDVCLQYSLCGLSVIYRSFPYRTEFKRLIQTLYKVGGIRDIWTGTFTLISWLRYKTSGSFNN